MTRATVVLLITLLSVLSGCSAPEAHSDFKPSPPRAIAADEPWIDAWLVVMGAAERELGGLPRDLSRIEIDSVAAPCGNEWADGCHTGGGFIEIKESIPSTGQAVTSACHEYGHTVAREDGEVTAIAWELACGEWLTVLSPDLGDQARMLTATATYEFAFERDWSNAEYQRGAIGAVHAALSADTTVEGLRIASRLDPVIRVTADEIERPPAEVWAELSEAWLALEPAERSSL